MDDLQERCRLASQLKGVVNKAEECLPKLRDGFIDENDYEETKKTIEHLGKEILEINIQITNGLNGKD